MTSINSLFRARIGFPEDEQITFDKLESVLDKVSKTIPFENLRIIKKLSKPITKQNLMEKILINNEGGLCYEVNPLFFHFLQENGFEVQLVRGRTFNFAAQEWSAAGRTHILSLLTHEGEKYVIDSGFGGNLPLKPVPLSGEIVSSANGDFRIRRINSDEGDYLLELKLKHRDKDWVNGYIFRSNHAVTDEAELNEVQQLIEESPSSPFNKNPLVTRFISNGNLILTDSSFIERKDGQESKQIIDDGIFENLAKTHFGITITE